MRDKLREIFEGDNMPNFKTIAPFIDGVYGISPDRLTHIVNQLYAFRDMPEDRCKTLLKSMQVSLVEVPIYTN